MKKYDEFMEEIQKMCKELMATKARKGTGCFRQDNYESDYDRREGRTMPITLKKDLLVYD